MWTMDVPLSPARQSRQKRLSHDEDEDSSTIIPTPKESWTFLHSHFSAIIATFCVCLVFFSNCVSPLVAHMRVPLASTVHAQLAPIVAERDHLGLALALGDLGVHLDLSAQRIFWGSDRSKHNSTPLSPDDLGLALATGDYGLHRFEPPAAPPAAAPRAALDPPPPTAAVPDDLLPFVLAAALVHTLLVSFGFALSVDERDVPLLGVGTTSFCILCLSLWAASSFDLGPIPPVGHALVGGHRTLFVIGGAATMTLWLVCSMLTPHDLTRSSTFHALVMALSASLYLFNISAVGCLAGFVMLGSGAVLASRGMSSSRV